MTMAGGEGLLLWPVSFVAKVKARLLNQTCICSWESGEGHGCVRRQLFAKYFDKSDP